VLPKLALKMGSRGIDTANQRPHYFEAGCTRFLGVSNVSLRHLEQTEAAGAGVASFVQNRCFARLGWDRDVRAFCRDRKIIYQGFSLLTANSEVLRHPLVAGISERSNATRAQVIFRLPRQPAFSR
jgi:diketogulonate reductase-like aldo/keto reductase